MLYDEMVSCGARCVNETGKVRITLQSKSKIFRLVVDIHDCSVIGGSRSIPDHMGNSTVIVLAPTPNMAWVARKVTAKTMSGRTNLESQRIFIRIRAAESLS